MILGQNCMHMHVMIGNRLQVCLTPGFYKTNKILPFPHILINTVYLTNKDVLSMVQYFAEY